MSAYIAMRIIDNQSIEKKTTIGYDYSAKKKNKKTVSFFKTKCTCQRECAKYS